MYFQVGCQCPSGQDYEFPLEDAFESMDKIRYLVQTIDGLFLTGNAADLFQSKKRILPSIQIIDDDIEIDWGNTTENVLQAWSQRSSIFIRLNDNDAVKFRRLDGRKIW